MSAPLSKSPMPMTVVSGYLGAGKTTLVNHLLRNAEGRRLFVVVNDFGEIAIDAELIEAREGDSLTLANGCVCCSLGGDLYRALDRVLRHEPRPHHLIVEASGVAEPERIAEVARAEPELRAAGVVVLCDAETLAGRLAEPLLTRALTAQLAAADVLLLNKCDRVSPDALGDLEALLVQLNKRAEIRRVTHAQAEVAWLLDRAHTPDVPPAVPSASHGALYESWSWSGATAPSIEELRKALSSLPDGLLRLKGLLVADRAASAWEVQSTGGAVTIKAKAVPEGTRPGLRLVAIGLRGRFDRAELERRIRRLEQIETVQ